MHAHAHADHRAKTVCATQLYPRSLNETPAGRHLVSGGVYGFIAPVSCFGTDNREASAAVARTCTAILHSGSTLGSKLATPRLLWGYPEPSPSINLANLNLQAADTMVSRNCHPDSEFPTRPAKLDSGISTSDASTAGPQCTGRREREVRPSGSAVVYRYRQ